MAIVDPLEWLVNSSTLQLERPSVSQPRLFIVGVCCLRWSPLAHECIAAAKDSPLAVRKM